MQICALNELIHQNFNVFFVNALKQFWHTTKFFQCLGAPKKQNLLLYLNGCKITYTDKSGKTFTANSGDIVYTPIGSEYKAQLSDFENASSCTVGINFFIKNSIGEDLVLTDAIQIFRADQNRTLPFLFDEILRMDDAQDLLKTRIILMQILSSLASHANAPTALPSFVSKALRYLSEHVEENPTVSKLAKLCHISEVYFRKQFKAYTGKTPSEYRNALRLEKARSYLEYGDVSVQEISDTLGYSTVSHFIKEFRRKHGCSPLKYRKCKRAERQE